MTLQEAGFVWATLEDAYPRWETRKGTQGLYLSAMGPLDYGETCAAVADWIEHSKFPPVIAELRSAVSEVHRTREAAAQAGRVLHALPAQAGDTPETRRKALAQMDNLRRWKAGDITTADMIRESARIYASGDLCPPDVLEVADSAESAIDALRQPEAKYDPSRSALNGVMRRLATSNVTPILPKVRRREGSA